MGRPFHNGMSTPLATPARLVLRHCCRFCYEVSEVPEGVVVLPSAQAVRQRLEEVPVWEVVEHGPCYPQAHNPARVPASPWK
mmetsp:Transcript_95913/g.310991  ORF Transcript_95913/g.310991 Transcript_95913/m.310991 type:complete len:82 (+) Transcript_95913:1499-1744(+)